MTATVFAMLAMVWLSGCGHIFKPPADDAGARAILERLMRHNSELTQYKGLAGIQIRMKGRSHSARIAFAAVQPDKMRVELLNLMGTPLTSLSGDGEMVTVISHGDQKRYRFRQTRTALSKLIEIPIGIEDLQSLLAGRVPVPPHVSVQSATNSQNETDEEIVLKNRWGDTVAKLQTDAAARHIKTLRVMDSEGALQYHVLWAQWREIDGYRLPSELIIETADNHRLTLTMDRFWPNAKVAPSMFVLEPKGKHRS